MHRLHFIFFFIILIAKLSAVDTAHVSLLVIANHTGYDLHHIFISILNDSFSGPDILAVEDHTDGERLITGNELSAYIHFQPTDSKFSILLINEYFDHYIVRDIQIEKNMYVSVGREYYEATFNTPDVSILTITNASSEDIFFLFLSPAWAHSWGADILSDEEILEVGESTGITILTGESNYDILGIGKNSVQYYRPLSLGIDKTNMFIDISDADRIENF